MAASDVVGAAYSNSGAWSCTGRTVATTGTCVARAVVPVGNEIWNVACVRPAQPAQRVAGVFLFLGPLLSLQKAVSTTSRWSRDAYRLVG